jgi:hypothetical protein
MGREDLNRALFYEICLLTVTGFPVSAFFFEEGVHRAIAENPRCNEEEPRKGPFPIGEGIDEIDEKNDGAEVKAQPTLGTVHVLDDFHDMAVLK